MPGTGRFAAKRRPGVSTRSENQCLDLPAGKKGPQNGLSKTQAAPAEQRCLQKPVQAVRAIQQNNKTMPEQCLGQPGTGFCSKAAAGPPLQAAGPPGPRKGKRFFVSGTCCVGACCARNPACRELAVPGIRSAGSLRRESGLSGAYCAGNPVCGSLLCPESDLPGACRAQNPARQELAVPGIRFAGGLLYPESGLPGACCARNPACRGLTALGIRSAGSLLRRESGPPGACCIRNLACRALACARDSARQALDVPGIRPVQ